MTHARSSSGTGGNLHSCCDFLSKIPHRDLSDFCLSGKGVLLLLKELLDIFNAIPFQTWEYLQKQAIVPMAQPVVGSSLHNTQLTYKNKQLLSIHGNMCIGLIQCQKIVAL